LGGEKKKKKGKKAKNKTFVCVDWRGGNLTKYRGGYTEGDPNADGKRLQGKGGSLDKHPG